MKRKHYKQLTAEEFFNIRELINQGWKKENIKRVTGRGSWLINAVSNTRTFNEYKNYVRSYVVKYSKKNTEQKKPIEAGFTEVTPRYTDTCAVIETDNERLLKALIDIGNQLKRLAEAWEQKPKRGIFG